MKKLKRSLSKTLIITIALCWLLPVGAVVFAVNVFYYRGMNAKIDDMMKAEIANFSTIVSGKIDEAVDMSKKLTYDGSMDRAYDEFKNGSATSVDFKKAANNLLKGNFGSDPRISMAVMFLKDNTDTLYHSLSGNSELREHFTTEVRDAALNVNNMGGTDVHLSVVDNKIFVIRNLIAPSMYKQYGTLVLEMDTDELFSSARGIDGYDVRLYINGRYQTLQVNRDVELGGENGDKSADRLKKAITDTINTDASGTTSMGSNGSYTAYMYQKQCDSCHLTTLLMVDESVNYAETKHMTMVFILLFVAFLPVIALVVYILKINISIPISKVLAGYKEIEEGHFGARIEASQMPNAEFTQLSESFNDMSGRLDYLFDYAYKEKLARRDAAIIALQSRINPHFLNNTLEMMNWQARMAGDAAVSKMIEALSTLLDYSMDRNSQKLINLSEELRCADSYFYIISMRYGQRLKVEKKIDEETLQCLVPRLILQPLLENAVVHGVEKQNEGTVRLLVEREGDDLVMKVYNTGKPLDAEAMMEIDRILADYRVEELETIEVKSSVAGLGKEKSEDAASANIRKGRVSIGIRNVNERIKLLYGDSYGLKIRPAENNETVAIIRIPYQKEES